jgi:hypothetical protein
LTTTSVPIPRRIVFWRDDETSAFLGAFVDGLYDVDQFLLVLKDSVHLVVVSGAKVTHHVFVTEEEHERHEVVQRTSG